MSSMHIKTLVPPGVPAPRGAVLIGTVAAWVFGAPRAVVRLVGRVRHGRNAAARAPRIAEEHRHG